MTGPDCDKMTVYHQARLPFGLTLPATLAVERTVRYAAAETERPEAEARAEGQEQLLRQLQVMLDAGEGQLLRHSFDAARQGKWLVVTLRAECEEQIGVSCRYRPMAPNNGGIGNTQDTGRQRPNYGTTHRH